MTTLWEDWKPIDTAPSGVRILLAWDKCDEEGFDWACEFGTLSEGRWIDGPGSQPDWWMNDPPPPPSLDTP